jgi:methylated-DNA-[protein]-cysteine S-methyltransferase
MESAFITYQSTPIGLLQIIGSDTAIGSVLFVEEESASTFVDHPLAIRACVELREYFDKQRTEFTLPLEPAGTAFQQVVWRELMRIPFGSKRSYNDIAIAVGDPKTVRAVGNANGRNPIAIVIPCHRVVGTNGALTGYAGGLWRKQWLLEHESSERAPQLF